MKKLIGLIKEGDKEAFKMLYDQYAEYAIRVSMTITKNKAVAADAVQETFIRVYNNIDTFDENKPFEPWLYRILINECNRILKSQSKTIPMGDYLESGSSVVEEDSYKFEEYEELYTAIKELDDINKIPIVLKYLKGFTEVEIADILNLNVNTIKSRLFKGRKKLKEMIEKFNEGRNQYE
ncbi:MAG: RNA polymerase sigma factor [Clostridiaceae bacterium]|nr:RNA polymerase sigma factor [Clostridiaceae bacterium]